MHKAPSINQRTSRKDPRSPRCTCRMVVFQNVCFSGKILGDGKRQHQRRRCHVRLKRSGTKIGDELQACWLQTRTRSCATKKQRKVRLHKQRQMDCEAMWRLRLYGGIRRAGILVLHCCHPLHRISIFWTFLKIYFWGKEKKAVSVWRLPDLSYPYFHRVSFKKCGRVFLWWCWSVVAPCRKDSRRKA